MNVLITGSNGFIAKNLIAELETQNEIQVLPLEKNSPLELINEYCKTCDFVFNLAGINRPENKEEYMEGNYCFALLLINTLKKYNNNCPVVQASSIQAVLDNPYGKSKKAGEDILMEYGRETGAPIYIYRFTNIFGKWCRPNYNSVIATFCYNLAHNIPIKIHDRNKMMHFVYIDDVVEELLKALDGHPHMNEDRYCFVPLEYEITLGKLADLLQGFKNSRENFSIPYSMQDSFEKKLYSTYLSYLPQNEFSYPLVMHEDERGSFTEILKSADRGQFSVNISKPGILKGNHWHHTKNEKFLVVSGRACIKFRQHGEKEVIEYHVSSENMEVIDIPAGYTHCIINEGDTDLVTFMWCNECFNPEKPDTIFEPVEKEVEPNE